MAGVLLSDDEYQDEIRDVLSRRPYRRTTHGPVPLLGKFLYIGCYLDAADLSKLHELGITHVLNMADNWGTGCPYDDTMGISRYKGFDADDSEHYDILSHFYSAKLFINDAKKKGGNVLVHCAMGINRSAAICAAYIMDDQNLDLLETVRLLKQRRGFVLANKGFQRRLIKFARENGKLPKRDRQHLMGQYY